MSVSKNVKITNGDVTTVIDLAKVSLMHSENYSLYPDSFKYTICMEGSSSPINIVTCGLLMDEYLKYHNFESNN